jgi:two-component system LytT family sensor kinase
LIISHSPDFEGYGIFFAAYLYDGQKRISMKFLRSRRFYINVIISLIISLTLVLPLILGMMGYDIFNRRQVPEPSRMISFWVVARQWLFYFLMVISLLTINTIDRLKFSFPRKVMASIVVTVVFYFLFSLVRPSPPVPDQWRTRPGMPETAMRQTNPQFPGQQGSMHTVKPFRPFGPDYRHMTEFLFVFLITILLGKVFELINVKQQMHLENEKLRSENLQNRYDVLLNQINPHFFFNSLNSLSSLVRDRRNENALRYIDELSNTYRYAMQSSGKELVAVTEELESLKAYSYLLGIRFEDKLFFEINIDDNALNMLLPVLSLQPLIENVVKHNVISTESPLTITIAGNREGITVMNPKRPRNTSGEKSGIGLNNLSTRYKLLTGKDLLIENGVYIFSVTLPLINPDDV